MLAIARARYFRSALSSLSYSLAALLLSGPLLLGCVAETSESETRDLEWLHAPGDGEPEALFQNAEEGVTREGAPTAEDDQNDDAVRLELARLLGARLQATQPAADAGRAPELLDDAVVSESEIEVDSSLDALRRLLDGGAP